LPSNRPERRFRDILSNIDWILEDVAGMSEANFLVDRTVQDAVLYRLLRISEAAAKLGSSAEDIAPTTPWVQIRSFGNALRHEYDAISLPQVWVIISRDLHRLRSDCEAALGRIQRP
jgi:uncharacterized protein with HEPN domain